MEKEVISDTDLLKLARQFDHPALAQIYDAYSPGLYRYSMRMLNDQDLAEDCVADTFSRFLRVLRTKRGPECHLQAYLYRMAHNWIVDHYRRGCNRSEELTEEHMDETTNTEKDASQHLHQECLRKALRKLTPDQQQVIALKYLEGWENEEIACSLKKPVGAIKSLQHRALAALQKILNREEFL
jgi:RNA polymerase sigma-70 factor (ECF subfamily)